MTTQWRMAWLAGLALAGLLAGVGGMAWHVLAGGSPRNEQTASEPAEKPLPGKTTFTKVEIELLEGADGPRKMPLSRTVTDPEEIAKLAAQLPELGQDKKGHPALEWKVGTRLTFHRAEGKLIRVTVNRDFGFWTEGNGDWDATPPFREQVKGLLNTVDQKNLEGKWQVVRISMSGGTGGATEYTEEKLKGMKWVIDGGVARSEEFGNTMRRTLVVKDAISGDMVVKPNEEDKYREAAYKLEGDALTIVIYRRAGQPQWRAVSDQPGSQLVPNGYDGSDRYILKRVPEKKTP